MKVLLNSLELTDFMSVKHEVFNFDHKVNFIQGPTASGKSTIFEAVKICFSSTKRGDTYKDYIRLGCTQAKILLKGTAGGKPIEFDVTLHADSGTAFEIDLTYDNGKPLHNSKSDSLIESLDLEFFSELAMFMQGDSEISQLTPMERLNYIKRLVEVSFDKDVTALKTSIDTLKVKIDGTKNLISSVEGSLSQMNIKPVPEYDQKRLDELIDQKNKLVEENDKKKAESQKLYNEIEDKQKLQNSLNAEMQSLNTRVTTSVNAAENIKKLEESVKELKETSKELEESLPKIIDETTRLNDEQKECNNKKDAATTKLAEHKELKKSTERLLELVKAGCCPTCGQKTNSLGDTSELEQKIAETQSSIEEDAATIDTNTTKLAELISKTNALMRQKASAETAIKGNANTISSNEKVINNTHCESTVELMSELAEKQKQHDDLTSVIGILKEEYKAMNVDNVDELMTLNAQINEIEKAKALHDSTIADNAKTEKDKIEFTANLEKYNKELADANKQYDATFEAWTILKKHLPGYMSAKVCKKIERNINDIIRIVYPDLSIKITHNLKGCDILMRHGDSDYLTSKMASGLEKSMISIAFKLALLQIYGINMMMADEIDKFSSNEDAVTIFETIIDSNLDQVFIITHKPGVVDDLVASRDDTRIYNMNKGCLSK